MMTFNAALETYKMGRKIKSIVSNKVYALGRMDIKNADEKEINGFWCLL